MDELLLKQILDEIKGVSERIAALESRAPVDPVICALNTKALNDLSGRVEVLEGVAKRDNMLRLVLGALGAGIVFALKGLWAWFIQLGATNGIR